MRVVQRGGGKNFLRMKPPQADSEEDESEEEDEPVPEQEQASYRVTAGGGGKSLARMKPPVHESEESDMEDGTASASKPQPATNNSSISRAPSGGKQLRRPEQDEEDEEPQTGIMPASVAPIMNRGKQLRQPEPRGKQLRRMNDDADEDDDGEPKLADAPKPPVIAPPSRGKQLRRPDEDNTNKDANGVVPTKTATPVAPPSRGKQLRLSEEPKDKPKPANKATPAPRGKQLRRPKKKNEESEDELEEEESEDDVDMELDDDEDDDDEDMEDEEEEFEEPPVAARARPKRAVAGKKKKTVREDSEDEDLIGDDDVSSDEDEAELDIHNTEALIQDEEDRKILEALPELQREAVLAERFDKLKAAQDMKKAMREAKMKEAASNVGTSKKRKAASTKKSTAKKTKKQTEADEELARALSDRRESSRNRDAKQEKSKKAAALAALKRERQIQQQQPKQDDSSDESMIFDDDEDSDDDYEEGGLKPWQQKKTRAARGGTSSRLDKDVSDDDMDIDDDEVPTQQKKSRSKSEALQSREEVEATLEDFLKCTIPRRRLGRWCHEPFFEAAVLECFVRLCIGEDESGDKVYRLCEIVEVKHGEKSYKMPVADPQKDTPVSTNIILTLKFGKSSRDFPMYLISDVPPDESDVHKYVVNQKNFRLEVLSKRRANKLRRLQDELVTNYTYTTEDIERNLLKRRKQGKTLAKLGLEQTRLGVATQAARDTVLEAERRIKEIKTQLMEASGNEASDLEVNLKEAEKHLDSAGMELKELEKEEKALQNLLQKRKSQLSQRTKDQNWAKVNERALQANQRGVVDVRKDKKDDAAASGAKKAEFNPFARRRVKPKVLWDVGQDAEKDETKQEEETTEYEKKENREDAPRDVAGLVNEPKEKGVALGDSHQFAIDEEGMAQSSHIAMGWGTKKKVVPTRARKGLSLQEYVDRKKAGTL
jgi:RNA polymerase-associated protein RTF1